MTKVIAIVNMHYGEGKTTTAINLAAGLAVSGHPTLVVDCDPQGNVTTGFGHIVEIGQPSLFQVLLGRVKAAQAVLHTKIDDLNLIPSAMNLIGWDKEVGLQNWENLIGDALGPILPKYDYIFLDCPPSLGLLSSMAIATADIVILPLQCQYPTLEGIALAMSTISDIRTHINPNMGIGKHFLFNRYNSHDQDMLKYVEHVQLTFKCDAFKTKIPHDERLIEAYQLGEPAVLYNAKSPGARSYLALAQEFMTEHNASGKGTQAEMENHSFD